MHSTFLLAGRSLPVRSWAWRWRLFAVLCLMLFALDQAFAASVPTGFLDKQLFKGLTSPSAMGSLPDGRVLVVQQNGVIRIVKSDAVLAANFYAVADVDSSSERGCLGVVADPGFANNHFVYFYCTVNTGSGSHNRVLRVTEAADKVVAGSERVILDLPNVPGSTRFHMGGGLRFGADGKLYISVGNHEDSPQPFSSSNSQKLSSAFGKVLRINPDGTVPGDNPFFNTSGAYKPVWALGLRNPFSMDIQPGSGLIYINEVGQSTWEEINRGQAGANYGWPASEGPTTDTRFVTPVHAYQHSGGACSVTGGAFYNPAQVQFPSGTYLGRYFFADFCTGQIRFINPASPANSSAFASGIGNPIGLTVTPDGSLYYVARNQGTGTPQPGAGTLSKISFTNNQLPRITREPDDLTVLIGTAATFSVGADNASSFQWMRNGVNIAGATGASHTTPPTTASDNGALFRVRVGNAAGSVDSRSAVLTVTTNRPPVARIDTPPVGTSYAAGETIAYSGVGTDPEDGSLPPTSMVWDVDFQHDAHAHDFIDPHTGTGGSFVATDFEAGESNSWIRIRLTVTDSMGQTAVAFRDVFKKKQITDFTPVGTPVNGFGPIENDRSNGESAAGDGKTITLGGIPYPRGLGVHAPSDVLYNLGGACSGSFISDVGVDDEVGSNGSVVFQLFLDGVKAFDSGIARGADLRKPVSVSVAGKQQMRLVVTDAGDGKSFDHADWAGARVTGCGATQLAIGNLQVADGANAADWSVQGNLQVGNLVYGDRTYTFTAIPASLLGAQWIRSANDSKAFTGNPLVTFTISAGADVYIALNNSTAIPSWVDDSWVDTGTDITTRESTTSTRTFSVFRKHFNAGTVSLGPWGATSSMYTVMVK
ncbi:MAG TPA: PQQ-dependent sugar dehydrogenase [Albitalea sp.]|uniref:PQQ-dependent sugar dehydrogenase n=1 Tax=Piscinibacter sp. TaxID=1903157 RepID=UPI002ED4F444